jgi:anti-sigma factor RsiW
MDCDRLALCAYHDQELAGVERETVEGHLRACASCREELAQLVLLQRELTALPEWEPGDATVARMVAAARMAAEERAPQPGWLRRLFTMRIPMPVPALALAAALIAVVACRAGHVAFVAQEDSRRGRPPAARLAVFEEWPDRGALWESPQTPGTPEAGHPTGRSQGETTHVIYQEFSIGI